VAAFVALGQGTFSRRRYHMSVLLTADITTGDGPYSIMLTHHTRCVTRDHGAPRVPAFGFPKSSLSVPMQSLPWACARATQEALTYSRSKMRAAKSDLGCAAPKSAMSSRYHGRTMPAWTHIAQNGAVTNCSLARRRQRWVPYHGNHGGRSRGVTPASSF
jgi:hypothetical protein